MAINAYTGLMGSGKSYEVVSSVIVPAVIGGRRVVTNIDGIQPEAIYEYCVTDRKANGETLGVIVPVTNDDVMNPGFFPDETKPDAPSLVKAGDLVAIDEAWNFWSVGNKLDPAHMRFFRMHRHYVHSETGVACDVALMIQSITDLHRQLRAVVEITFVTKKLKELGLTSSYRVELYEGGKTTKSSRLDTYNKIYRRAIFPLYQSYAGGKGKERSIDKRQNKLTNKRIWFIFALTVAMTVASGIYLVSYFRSFQQPEQASDDVRLPTAVAESVRVELPSAPSFSDEWRIAGAYETDSDAFVVVADSSGRLRVESPSMFSLKGIARIGTVDGQQVTMWTGGQATPSAGGAR
ncbi:zonular occludens toxin domain-containing protein [Pandoraea cepalis]|uniref:Zonular occludens toxin n=1 Tax=Pandoraea cepalis TaxID=2508294 RepID=A0A5E4XSK8_9BURK|nr:zonular occludens toxin domain-containing protein [Pandoraea cepalis]VVE39253.1 Zonular occludens toxin [Pandoraea cepalis]